MDYFETFISILLFVALVFALCLGVYLIAESIDQKFAEQTFAGYSVVQDKEAGTQRYFIMVGKVLVPQTRNYWKATYIFKDTINTIEITESCYLNLEKGQKIGIYVKKGFFSKRYYLDCR